MPARAFKLTTSTIAYLELVSETLMAIAMGLIQWSKHVRASKVAVSVRPPSAYISVTHGSWSRLVAGNRMKSTTSTVATMVVTAPVSTVLKMSLVIKVSVFCHGVLLRYSVNCARSLVEWT